MKLHKYVTTLWCVCMCACVWNRAHY